ncbi:MAG: thioesterase family protein [Pseudomonadota bacterium]
MSRFDLTISPRTYETDAWGHINNNSICAWFEVARTTYIKDVLSDGKIDAPNSWVLATMSVDFLRETFYGSDVEVSLTRAEVGNTSLTLECAMHQNEQQTVRCSAVLVYIDRETKQSRRIPDAMRALVQIT